MVLALYNYSHAPPVYFQMLLKEMNNILADKDISIQDKEQEIMLIKQERDELTRENQVCVRKDSAQNLSPKRGFTYLNYVYSFRNSNVTLRGFAQVWQTSAHL